MLDGSVMEEMGLIPEGNQRNFLSFAQLLSADRKRHCTASPTCTSTHPFRSVGS